MNRDKIIEIAGLEVGNSERPFNSNKTKYGKWFGFDGVAWCGIFVSWCYAQAGFKLDNIGFTKGFAGCQSAVAYYKKNNRIVKNPQKGDLVFFDFNKDKRFDHVGIYVRHIDGTHFEAIEGNTSTLNQNNGGCVMKKTRTYKDVIFARPSCLDSI